MEQENEGLYDDVVTEEEASTSEVETNEESNDSDVVTISKAELNKIKRKALAYNTLKESAQESKPATNQEFNQTPQGLSREEAIFIASGYTEDDLNYLNVVAKGTGLPIKEAKEHPLFETYLQKVEADKKAKRAKLGASKGSSTQKPVELAGMSPEEHKKYWASRMGN